jgi:ribonuclease P protein component
MLPRTARLRSSSDFNKVYGRGASVAGRYLVVYILNEKGSSRRLGMSVSRRVGRAVVRNKVRRRLAEAYSGLDEVAPTGDCVIIARRPAAEASYHILEEEMRSLFDKAANLKA